MKKISTKILLVTLVTTLFLATTASASLNSLAVWENIAGGTLTSTWSETTNANWKGQNVSGAWSYNCTTNAVNWTYNTTVSGSRWYHTWEVTSDDAEAGVGSGQFKDATHFYAVIYYVAFNNTTPACYIIYNNAGTINYWDDGVGFTTNISNATDYTATEYDFTSGYVRIKAEWNWKQNTSGDCTVRFKVWSPSGTEPILWMVDEIITVYPGDASTTYKSGLVVDGRWDIDPAQTLFRRIFFWSLTYDLYSTTQKPKIVCPTYDAMDFYTLLTNLPTDVWNSTQTLKTFFNTWDLTSYYDDAFYDAGDYNDTNYVFTNMLVDFTGFWRELYPNTPLPTETPDNALIIYSYETIDGNTNTGDEYLIRIDSDNNGVYNSYDYAFLMHSQGTFQAYQGWTVLNDPDQWYGRITDSWSSSGTVGEMFADHGYHIWTAYINWDLLYNGSSHQRIGQSLCRISISHWNENDSLLSIWQDWNQTNDITQKTASEQHNSSRTPTWRLFNTTTNWGYFSVDDTIGGADPFTDPDDPASVYDDMDDTTRNLMQDILPLLLAVLIFSVIVGIIFTTGVTKESLISIMILCILGIVIIQVILGL
jgi:hypothetical protein